MDDILKPINTPKDKKPAKPKESNPKPSKPTKAQAKSKAKLKVIEEPILFTPSSEQQLIIDAIKRGENVSVNAVAGSGKTTTILGIAKQIPEKKILQITYNLSLIHISEPTRQP
jgi:superfamily II DNA or RNA helicase